MPSAFVPSATVKGLIGPLAGSVECTLGAFGDECLFPASVR